MSLCRMYNIWHVKLTYVRSSFVLYVNDATYQAFGIHFLNIQTLEYIAPCTFYTLPRCVCNEIHQGFTPSGGSIIRDTQICLLFLRHFAVWVVGATWQIGQAFRYNNIHWSCSMLCSMRPRLRNLPLCESEQYHMEFIIFYNVQDT